MYVDANLFTCIIVGLIFGSLALILILIRVLVD